MPRLAPVTTTLSIARQLSARIDGERGNEADERRHLIGRELPGAGGDDLVLQTRRFDDAFVENDIGRDQRAGDRIPARLDETGVHAGVPVDHRLDFFRVHLGAADIDDAAAASDEIATVVAQFDHVASVDETVGVAQGRRIVAEIAQGGAARADGERAVDDLEEGAILALAEIRVVLSGLPVIDFEAYARFRRSEGMGDARAWKEFRQSVD